MSKRKDEDLLLDIKEAMRRIRRYTKGMSYKNFMKDSKTQDAVVRNLEIIGEAVKMLSKELKEKYPQFPWKELAGMRDKLIHHYFGINYDLVWGIIEEEIESLSEQIKKILEDLE